MGYSTSKLTLERVRPKLANLEQGQSCIWYTEPNESHKLAYKLREGLYIAKLYPGEYPQLAEAAARFKIEVVSSREVRATELKNVEVSVQTQLNLDGIERAAVMGKGLRTFAGSQTAATIIQSWIDTQPSNEKYHFPEANLDEQEIHTLWLWSKKQHLIFFVSDSYGITLQKTQRDLEDLAWTPEDIGMTIEET